MASCEGCDGSGIRPGAPAHSTLPVPDGFVVVERCDTCERFASDHDAAAAYGTDVRERHSPCGPGGDTICRPLRSVQEQLIAACKAAVPWLTLLGDYIGNGSRAEPDGRCDALRKIHDALRLCGEDVPNRYPAGLETLEERRAFGLIAKLQSEIARLGAVVYVVSMRYMDRGQLLREILQSAGYESGEAEPCLRELTVNRTLLDRARAMLVETPAKE